MNSHQTTAVLSTIATQNKSSSPSTVMLHHPQIPAWKFPQKHSTVNKLLQEKFHKSITPSTNFHRNTPPSATSYMKTFMLLIRLHEILSRNYDTPCPSGGEVVILRGSQWEPLDCVQLPLGTGLEGLFPAEAWAPNSQGAAHGELLMGTEGCRAPGDTHHGCRAVTLAWLPARALPQPGAGVSADLLVQTEICQAQVPPGCPTSRRGPYAWDPWGLGALNEPRGFRGCQEADAVAPRVQGCCAARAARRWWRVLSCLQQGREYRGLNSPHWWGESNSHSHYATSGSHPADQACGNRKKSGLKQIFSRQ